MVDNTCSNVSATPRRLTVGLFALAVLMLTACVGPAPVAPPDGCTECGVNEAPLPSGDCYPYCGGEEPPEEGPQPQATPSGRYLGTWMLTAVEGQDAAACLNQTPIGFQLAHRIKVVAGVTVTERDSPCTTTNANPGDFGFSCINYNFWSTCSTDSTSPNYFSANPDCRQWWERVVESLQFSVDAKHSVGAVTTERNWPTATCTYRWTARYDWIAYP